MSATERDLGQDRAHSARVHNYYLGGKTNYIIDRDAGDAVTEILPTTEITARVNHAYMQRVGRYLVRQGVRQFIDLGTGIPFPPNAHDVVQAMAPDATVVYVDHDPIVLVYADELEDGSREGITRIVEADMRRPEELLAAVDRANCIDFGRPVALIMHAVLDFLPDHTNPYGIVSRLLEPLAPGSYLSLTHCTSDFAPETWGAVIDTYERRGIQAHARTKTEVLRFFRGLELADPGLVVAHRWWPEPASGPSLVTDAQVSMYAGLARRSAGRCRCRCGSRCAF